MRVIRITKNTETLASRLAKFDDLCFEVEKLTQKEWQKFLTVNTEWVVFCLQDNNGLTVGMSVIVYKYNYIAYLYSIAILPNHRGRNLSSLLMAEHLNFFPTKILLQAHTRASNTSIIKVLEKFNFKAIQYLPDCFGDFEDGILWELSDY